MQSLHISKAIQHMLITCGLSHAQRSLFTFKGLFDHLEQLFSEINKGPCNLEEVKEFSQRLNHAYFTCCINFPGSIDIRRSFTEYVEYGRLDALEYNQLYGFRYEWLPISAQWDLKNPLLHNEALITIDPIFDEEKWPSSEESSSSESDGSLESRVSETVASFAGFSQRSEITLATTRSLEGYQMWPEPELWKMTLLDPERPPPLGTQHRTCEPGTREAILREIRQWRTDYATRKRIFWLCDLPSSGKSTVALTMCEEWDSIPDIVVGRFFFSNSDCETSKTDAFCSFIAEDIGSKNQAIMKEVENAWKENPRLIEQGLHYQFTKLIEEPLRFANEEVILVIDGVDECERAMRVDLLAVLVDKLSSMNCLKLFITSRPEHDIIALLRGRPIVHEVNFKIQSKQEEFHADELVAYTATHTGGILTAAERQQLVEHSNGLFIWIQIAVSELQQADGPDAVQITLANLLNSGEPGDINQIYSTIIRRILQKTSPDIISKVIGTVLTLFEPVSTKVLAEFIDIALLDLEQILMSMKSLFHVDSVVKFLHPTFRSYLLTGQNLEMSFDLTVVQSILSVSMLNILKSGLKQDICQISKLDAPYPNNKDVPELGERLLRVWSSSPALEYTIRYWGYHTRPIVTNKDVAKVLQTLLETCMLYLVELLSLMDQIYLIQNLEEIRKGFEDQQLYPPEVELCRDVVRLVQRHQTTFKESALHIYSSALLFIPRQTRLWVIYGSQFLHRLPSIVGVPSERWPLAQIFTGHRSAINCLAFSPDGTRIGAGFPDGGLQLWDRATGVSLAKLEGHTDSVSCLAFSSDGTRIVSGSWDHTLRLWDAANGSSIGKMEGHSDIVGCLAFSPDGSRITSGSWDRTLQVWDGRTGESIGKLEGHTGSINCVAYSPGGAHIISGSEDGTLQLWDAETGINKRILEGHSDSVNCLVYSPDGTHLASGSSDRTLRLWDATTGLSIGRLEGHTGSVSCLAFSPCGTRIVSGSSDQTLRLWDAETTLNIATLKGHTESVSCLAFSPDGTHVASGSLDRTLRIWDTATGVNTGNLKGHTDSVSCLAFSPDGTHIASGSRDWTLRLWDTAAEVNTGEPEGHANSISCLAFSADGSCIASGSEDGTLQLWNATTGASMGKLEGHADSVSSLVFLPDGIRIASGSWDHTLRLWDTSNLSMSGCYKLDVPVIKLEILQDDGLLRVNKAQEFDISDPNPRPIPSSAAPSSRPAIWSPLIRVEGQKIWHSSSPSHIFRFPDEFEIKCYALHQNRAVFGLASGQCITIDFTKILPGRDESVITAATLGSVESHPRTPALFVSHVANYKVGEPVYVLITLPEELREGWTVGRVVSEEVWKYTLRLLDHNPYA
ncbi:hypothetical protein PIIN_08536 [Serendipita indica DSM 11827]|uniref:Uncharacterized protein n=1 Tax=Serendipita indica (strain DSM 11827) TaxID=1109443 RepID=G4TTE1_SERID|nr:hypothetical protein PIIN_08536 [Serendipita indica DSM 11827]